MRDDSELIRFSATETAGLIARGDLSAMEAVEARIAGIQDVNLRLNAVVVRVFEQARAEARAADSAQAHSSSLDPRRGVPITIKEMFDLAGTPPAAVGYAPLVQAPSWSISGGTFGRGIVDCIIRPKQGESVHRGPLLIQPLVPPPEKQAQSDSGPGPLEDAH